VRHVSIFGDDLEALNGLGVAYDIVKVDWTVLFYPVTVSRGDGGEYGVKYQGSS
jgi:hypothetical protein